MFPRLLGAPLRHLAGASVLFCAAGVTALPAQEPGQVRDEALPNVFFDCDGQLCREQDYYRTHITWVNWVRDRQDADLHLIMTSQSTGAGGREFQLDFLGTEAFPDYEDQILYATLPTETEREELDGVVHTMAVGFARFAAVAGFRGIVELAGVDPEGFDPTERVVSAQEVDDPWNLWVFRINGSATLDGEKTQKDTDISTSFSASRVTPRWKLDFDGAINYDKRRRDLEDDSVFRDSNTDWSMTGLVVNAIAPHWSLGIRAEARRQRSVNQDLRVAASPAIEYSFFPYSQATRRSLTAFYVIGPTYRDYIERTALGEDEELLFEHALELEFSQRQPWGEASVSIQGSHFLHDTSLNALEMRGNISYRIFRGFSVNSRASIGWVNDQIYLSGRGRTDEEALLNLVRGAQDFNYCMSVGFSFQFGSIFNNVVNNRFSGAGFPGGGMGGGFGCRGFGF